MIVGFRTALQDIRERRNKQRNASADAPTACPWAYCTCKVMPSSDVDVLLQVINEQERELEKLNSKALAATI